MTIHIPCMFLLFVLYTCAVLGGAFGISYAVFEWRDDSPDKTEVGEIEAIIEQLDDDMGKLESRISTLSSDINNASGHSHDDCGGKIAVYVLGAIGFSNRVGGLVGGERDAAFDALSQLNGEMQAACR